MDVIHLARLRVCARTEVEVHCTRYEEQARIVKCDHVETELTEFTSRRELKINNIMPEQGTGQFYSKANYNFFSDLAQNWGGLI